MNTEPSQDKILNKIMKLTNTLWTLVACAIVVITAWILIPFALVNWLSTKNLPDNAGVIGDMFGSVNALFAGLAFLLLIWSVFQSNQAIKIQQQELSLQREELKESREVLKDQAESQEKMIEAITELSQQTKMASHVSARSALIQANMELLGNPRMQVHTLQNEPEIASDLRVFLLSMEKYVKSIQAYD